MREILYRAKAINRDERKNYRSNYKNGDWVYGLIGELYAYDERFIAEMTNTDGISGIDVNSETINECSGLKDKNGTAIYEHDICKVVYRDVRCDMSGKSYETEYELIEEVEFVNGTYCFKTDFEGIAMYRPIGFELFEKVKIKSYEVIGNIYDNPELLKGE